MAFLTDRTLATGVTLQDLIHIVITGDTSQGNFAGSSYKATIGQVSNTILSGLTDVFVTGGTYSAGTATFTNNTGGTFNVTGFYTGGTDLSITSVGVSAYTATTIYTYYGVTYSGNTDIEIPNATTLDGFNFKIKDERGTAGSYRIRLTPIVGTIDGNPFVDMNINYMSLTIMARNNNWWII